MIAALLGLDATSWAVLTGLVALGVVAVLAVALTVGLIVGRVIRARDRQIPHADLRTHLIAVYGLDDDCTDDRIVLAAMDHVDHIDRTD